MSVKVEHINKREYNLLGDLDDEENIFTLDEYDGSTYICDAFMEIADSNIPIYNHDIWKNAPDISEYIEEAIAQGITDVSRGLESIFQAGYYEYYTQSLYQNLDTMVFNMIADKVNDFLNENSELLENLELDQIEDEIDLKSNNYDNNHRMDRISDDAEEIIQMIKDGEYSL